MEVEGDDAGVARFLQALREELPPQASIEHMRCEPRPLQHDAEFRIIGSLSGRSSRPSFPADLATCEECVHEIRDAGARRECYPFTNCTNCGPRLSIIEDLPYDRAATSMRGFPMCEACRLEYADPLDRRFHAQPIACPRCGPRLWLVDLARHVEGQTEGRPAVTGGLALDGAVAAILAHRIVALKGMGGFQLLADATSGSAVARLRERKQRGDKPFALMMGSLEAVRRYCKVSEAEARLLQSAAAPIVLLEKASDALGASHIPSLGVMLPCTPLHHLLMERVGRPLVCTSGNRSEEPICIDESEAHERLSDIADVMLTHDRPIVRPVDDSVARIENRTLQVLRRARGYAPLPIRLAFDVPPMLAVGAHLKNAFCLGQGRDAWMSPHIGDLDDVRASDLLARSVDDVLRLFRMQPEKVACDLHPDYASTRLAESLARAWSVPLVRVQHHHAHVVACMAEHHVEGPVLGLVWDGAGYGTDGTVWGGEALLATMDGFERCASLVPFLLPGGDRAARDPRRVAFSMLWQVLGEEAACEVTRGWFDDPSPPGLARMLERRLNSPACSSMGRLFDAVAALAGVCRRRTTFEGEAAMALEALLGPEEEAPYTLRLDGPRVAWDGLVEELLADVQDETPLRRISGRFHASLVELALMLATHAGCPRIVLSGGCFQNAWLSRRIRQRLEREGFQVWVHQRVPPNDGGIALGQLASAGFAHGSDRSDRSYP